MAVVVVVNGCVCVCVCSVATCFRYGDIFKHDYVANLLPSLIVEEF